MQDSFNPAESATQNHAALEEVSLIFNIAAILTSLAADQSRTSEEGPPPLPPVINLC